MSHEMFQTRSMTQAVITLHQPTSFFLSRFFGGSPQYHNSHEFIVDTYKRGRKAAAYVKCCAAGIPLDSVPASTHAMTIPCISLVSSLELCDKELREPGESPFSNRTPADRARSALKRKLEEANAAIAMAEEIQAVQAIRDARVIIRGKSPADETINAEADFGRSPSHSSVPSVLWNNPAADINGDFMQENDKILRDSGYTPDTVVMGSNALRLFLKNETVLKLLDTSSLAAGKIALGAKPNVTGASFHGIFAGKEIWSYGAYYTPADSDDYIPMIAPNIVIFATSDTRNQVHYGPIIDHSVSVREARFAKSWVTEEPPIRHMAVKASPLVAAHEPDASSVLTVA